MYTVVKQIMSPVEVLASIPSTPKIQQVKQARDKQIKDILSNKDKRKIFIVGPCSADNEDSVCDYVYRLAEIAEKVKDKLFIIPRIYTNKPRTKGEGYKGMLHSPDPNKGTDINAGIIALRKMHVRAITESGLTAADEMLYPENASYIEDLLSYITIGARSCENQQHRLVSSLVDVPVGIKNPMNGSLAVLLNSIYAAQIKNEFKYQNAQVASSGNEFTHAVLRGSVDLFGNNVANYHYEDLIKMHELYTNANLKNSAIIVDCNHSNSNKDALQQVRIAKEIFATLRYNTQLQTMVKGIMLESYIEDGAQPPTSNVYGKSITDACLGIEKTKKLIFDIAEKL